MTTTNIQDGLHIVPEQEYHASHGVSKSLLDHFNRSPQHYLHALNNPMKSTPAMAMGSLVHCMNLENHRLESEYAVAPEADKRTKAGKLAHAEFAEKLDGRTAVTQKDMNQAEAITNALANHPLAHMLLTEEGLNERAIYSTDRETGLLKRGRFDRTVLGKGIYDLKTTSDASPDAFMKSILSFNYHVQAAYYLDMAEEQGLDCPVFKFICVEKHAPYGIAVYELDEYALKAGRDQYRRNLRGLKECLDTQKWTSYFTGVHKLVSPKWIS